MDPSALADCRAITDDMINEAIESREDTRALFERAVEIAKPNEGGARVLLIFAKMASPACDWLEGALRVELNAKGTGTTIESVVDIGAGLKERVFPTRTINVPLDEFLTAIKKFPRALAPLTAESGVPGRLLLLAPEAERDDTESEPPPPPQKIALEAPALPLVDAAATVVGAPEPPPVSPLANTAPVDAQRMLPKPLAKLKLRKAAVARPVAAKPPGAEEAAAAPAPVAPAQPADAKNSDVDKGWDE